MRKFHDSAAIFARKAGSLLAVGVMATAFGCSSFAAWARPLVPAEHRFDYYSGRLPSCADPSVFERIQSRFHARESEFWKSGLEILGFDRVREIGMRSHGLDHIPRRYCMARAYMNDHSLRTVSYNIAEGQGIIGFGFGVDWCVAGLDRNHADAPNCKMARP
jgi:hypothetical protein